jgi:hypothetical protein
MTMVVTAVRNAFSFGPGRAINSARLTDASTAAAISRLCPLAKRYGPEAGSRMKASIAATIS